MRENTAAGIVHPEILDGRAIWKAPEIEDLIHRLHFGDATLGWSGDPALALYRSADKRWELWRLESDGQYRMVMRSRPGLALDNRVIMHLVAHDVRRGYNVHNALTAHNAAVDAEKERRDVERTTEKLERVYHALGRDTGHLY